MSRRNRRLTCVYCSGGNGTDDHIFAREFFLEADRANLPKAPACTRCNARKAALETYATAVLPFMGKHEIATELLLENQRRLEGNNRLKTDLLGGMRDVVVAISPFDFQIRSTLPLEFDKIADLFGMISKALIWHHWRQVVSPDQWVDAIAIHSSEMESRLSGFNRPKDTVEVTLGRGTFSYTGIRATDRPQTSVWRYRVFGGGEFGLAENALPHDEIMVVCGRAEFVWDLMAMKLDKGSARP